ncbi:MAG: tol-pal system protein YbgF [Deltaproteobacteria bacterium]|nr:tol-pal system protein YbgF [Deltaproteobacteria bacterium]
MARFPAFPAFLVLSGLCVLSVLSAPPARAASTKELESQIAEIKRVQEAQSKNLATALNQIQEVLAEFQGLAGKIDQSQHGNLEQEKLIGDNQTRLSTLEDQVFQLSKQLEEIKAVGLMPQGSSKTLAEFQAYQKGLGKLNGQEFKEAIQTFKSFVTGNPKSPLVENAYYWIGEGYYLMRDYPAAIAEFQKAIKKNPAGDKAAASLLKQGFAFSEMQSFEDARVFLSKVVSKYPQSYEAVMARDKIRRIDDLLAKKQQEAYEMKSTR